MGFGLVPLSLQQPRECHRGRDSNLAADLKTPSPAWIRPSLMQDSSWLGPIPLKNKDEALRLEARRADSCEDSFFPCCFCSALLAKELLRCFG